MKNEKLTLARDYYFNHQYQEALKEFLYWYQKEEGITKIEAAFFIGKIYSILDYPLEVIKTRVALSGPGVYSGMWDVVRKTVANEGWRYVLEFRS